MKPARHNSGFTLLEMLVALVLVGVLTLSLYSSLRIGFNAQRSAEAAVTPILTAEAAFALLQADIESALPPTGILAGEFYGQDDVASSGFDGDRLTYHTASGAAEIEYDAQMIESGGATLSLFDEAPPQTVFSDVMKVELELVPDENGRDNNLVRRVTKNLLSPEDLEPAEQIICRNVVSFNLRYYDLEEWLDDWDSTQQNNALPRAIEVVLEIRRVDRSRVQSTESLTVNLIEDDQTTRPTQRLVRVFALQGSGSAEEEGNRTIR